MIAPSNVNEWFTPVNDRRVPTSRTGTAAPAAAYAEPQYVEKLEAIAEAARHWLAMRPNAHDSWSESTRKLAAAVTALDGA